MCVCVCVAHRCVHEAALLTTLSSSNPNHWPSSMRISQYCTLGNKGLAGIIITFLLPQQNKFCYWSS